MNLIIPLFFGFSVIPKICQRGGAVPDEKSLSRNSRLRYRRRTYVRQRAQTRIENPLYDQFADFMGEMCIFQ